MNELARENGCALPHEDAQAQDLAPASSTAQARPDLAPEADAQPEPEPASVAATSGSSGPSLTSIAKAALRTARIRTLNDQLRQGGRGGAVCVTGGVASLDMPTLQRVCDAVVEFDAFSPDNDPYGEHDCAVITVPGASVIWKIDTYDLNYTGLSPDPTDPAVTKRVLTIMLASEY